MIGDRVQAKWEDGKMYFGKVLQVYEGIEQMISCVYGAKTCLCLYICLCSDTVDVLFDDGVEYTAPFRAVRRRVNPLLLTSLVIIFVYSSFRGQTRQQNAIMIVQLIAQRQLKHVEAVRKSGQEMMTQLPSLLCPLPPVHL